MKKSSRKPRGVPDAVARSRAKRRRVAATGLLFRHAVLLALLACLPWLGGGRASADERAPVPHAVAFRFDDVQDHWLSGVQEAVIELFAEEGLKLTLAVIGGSIGNDARLVERIRGTQPLLSVASHGLHAKNGPDANSLLLGQPEEVTRREISEASAGLVRVFGRYPRVYVPHQNQFDDSLLRVLRDLGFSHLSSACARHNQIDLCEDECGSEPAGQPCGVPDRFDLTHVPSGAATQWTPWVGRGMYPVREVLRQIENSIGKYCFAVVMLHPQDFATVDEQLDAGQMQSLRSLLRLVKAAPERFEVVWLEDVTARCP